MPENEVFLNMEMNGTVVRFTLDIVQVWGRDATGKLES